MKLIFHIGLPKTGTTSLQSLLAASRGKLRSQGIIYPDFGIEGLENHHLLLRPICKDFSLEDGVWDARLKGQYLDVEAIKRYLHTKATSAKAHTMVLSSEIFTGGHAFFEQRIGGLDLAHYAQQLFSAFEQIEIVVCLRNQVEWLESCYIEAIKGGYSAFSGSIEEYILYRGREEYLDFNKLLAPWVACFGADSIRYLSYDFLRAEIRVVDGCLEALGIKPEWCLERHLNFENPRYGPVSLEMTRLFNELNNQLEVGGKYVSPGLDLVSGGDRKAYYMTQKMASSIMADFEASNRDLEVRLEKSIFKWPDVSKLPVDILPIASREWAASLLEIDLKAHAGLGDTKSELNALRAGLGDTKSELNALRAGLGDTKSELNALRAGLGDTKSELNALRAGLGDTKSELNALRAEFEYIKLKQSSLKGWALFKRFLNEDCSCE